MADHAAETPNKWVPSPALRKYIYRVLAAFGPIAIAYGFISDTEFVLWLGFVETVLVTPVSVLAAANTPSNK